MVCHLDIPLNGSVGPRVGARGGVTAIEYKTDLDYRIFFIGEGWKNSFKPSIYILDMPYSSLHGSAGLGTCSRCL
jgi:hypothetical protein